MLLDTRVKCWVFPFDYFPMFPDSHIYRGMSFPGPPLACPSLSCALWHAVDKGRLMALLVCSPPSFSSFTLHLSGPGALQVVPPLPVLAACCLACYPCSCCCLFPTHLCWGHLHYALSDSSQEEHPLSSGACPQSDWACCRGFPYTQ